MTFGRATRSWSATRRPTRPLASALSSGAWRPSPERGFRNGSGLASQAISSSASSTTSASPRGDGYERFPEGRRDARRDARGSAGHGAQPALLHHRLRRTRQDGRRSGARRVGRADRRVAIRPEQETLRPHGRVRRRLLEPARRTSTRSSATFSSARSPRNSPAACSTPR